MSTIRNTYPTIFRLDLHFSFITTFFRLDLYFSFIAIFLDKIYIFVLLPSQHLFDPGCGALGFQLSRRGCYAAITTVHGLLSVRYENEFSRSALFDIDGVKLIILSIFLGLFILVRMFYIGW